jgi:hypothetical protein
MTISALQMTDTVDTETQTRLYLSECLFLGVALCMPLFHTTEVGYEKKFIHVSLKQQEIYMLRFYRFAVPKSLLL